MKHLILLFAIVSVFFISCKKEVKTGSATFYTTTNQGENIQVYINGGSGLITQYYNAKPNCFAQGCYYIELKPGVYNYTASTSIRTISGTILIEEELCNRVNVIF